MAPEQAQIDLSLISANADTPEIADMLKIFRALTSNTKKHLLGSTADETLSILALDGAHAEFANRTPCFTRSIAISQEALAAVSDEKEPSLVPLLRASITKLYYVSEQPNSSVLTHNIGRVVSALATQRRLDYSEMDHYGISFEFTQNEQLEPFGFGGIFAAAIRYNAFRYRNPKSDGRAVAQLNEN